MPKRSRSSDCHWERTDLGVRMTTLCTPQNLTMKAMAAAASNVFPNPTSSESRTLTGQRDRASTTARSWCWKSPGMSPETKKYEGILRAAAMAPSESAECDAQGRGTFPPNPRSMADATDWVISQDVTPSAEPSHRPSKTPRQTFSTPGVSQDFCTMIVS